MFMIIKQTYLGDRIVLVNTTEIWLNEEMTSICEISDIFWIILSLFFMQKKYSFMSSAMSFGDVAILLK